MTPLFTVITPTGSRPEAFALCEKWVAQQTLLSHSHSWEWLVADDGQIETPCTMNQIKIPVQLNNTLVSSQFSNLTALLKYAKGRYIIVVEDDDYYGPHHFANVVFALQDTELVGERPSRYYNVKLKTFREFENKRHASLCQTAFRFEVIPEVLEVCANKSWIDVTLWQSFRRSKQLFESGEVVGIKGMPGRPGISDAHKGTGTGWRGDPGMDRLRQWIGANAEVYKKYAHG